MLIKKDTILFTVIIFLLIGSKIYSEDHYTRYLSPGITFGWNFGNGFAITPKIGLGVFNEDGGTYYNMTYGFNFCPGKNYENSDFHSYHFVEFEIGSIPKCSGGGLGIAFWTSNNKTQICPKLTAFIGLIFFVNMDVVITDNGINANLGLQPNIPFPIEHLKNSFRPGG
ncbi:MAG: hypothetical protein ACM3RX_08660 [Methanococcaceae archaeon]